MSLPKRGAAEVGADAAGGFVRRVKLKPRPLPVGTSSPESFCISDTLWKNQCAADFQVLLCDYMSAANSQIKPKNTWEKILQFHLAQDKPKLHKNDYHHVYKLVAVADGGGCLIDKTSRKMYVHEDQVFCILWHEFTKVHNIQAWKKKIERVWKSVHAAYQNIPKRLVSGLHHIMTKKGTEHRHAGARGRIVF
jgi:hypothetical protein